MESKKRSKNSFCRSRDGKMTFDKLTTEGDLPINKQNIIYFSWGSQHIGSNMDNTWQKALYILIIIRYTYTFSIIYEQGEHNPKHYIKDPA